MKVTKFEHACLVLEVEGRRLVIDPGAFTRSLDEIEDVVAVVITHEHADHWTADKLGSLRQQHPNARFFGPAGVAAAAPEFPIESVAEGDRVQLGPFELRFFGSRHALIHESMPIVDNVGVLVNDEFYYPGDAFTVPEGVKVDTLAVPSSGPWLRYGDVLDFAMAVQPRRCFPVHEAHLSETGWSYLTGQLSAALPPQGGEFFTLAPGETRSLDD